MSGLVVGYDGTEGARNALREAGRWAKDLGVGLHVVFSHTTSVLGGEMGDLDDAIRERAQAILAEGVAHLPDGLPVTTEVRRQETAEGLLEAAREREARAIVVGSYGEGPIKSALVGSTPTRLLHLSEIPILVVRAAS